MSRQHKIRWRKTDEQELNRIIKNYNSKISRIIKKEPYLETYLPSKISKKQIKEDIYSRRDFNREINKLKRFSRKGSESLINKDNLQLTKYEYNEFLIAHRANENRKRLELNKLMNDNIYKGHEKTQMSKHEMGNIKRYNLQPKKLKDTWKGIKNESEFSNFMKKLDKMLSDNQKEKKKELFKENYLKGIENVFGTENVLYRLIKKMNNNTFVSIYEKDDLYLRIDFIYDELQKKEKFNTIYETWKEYLGEV